MLRENRYFLHYLRLGNGESFLAFFYHAFFILYVYLFVSISTFPPFPQSLCCSLFSFDATQIAIVITLASFPPSIIS